MGHGRLRWAPRHNNERAMNLVPLKKSTRETTKDRPVGGPGATTALTETKPEGNNAQLRRRVNHCEGTASNKVSQQTKASASPQGR